MINWLTNLFKSSKTKKPKWRLTPNKHGSYNLEKWDSVLCLYLVEVVRITPDQADMYIERLERDKIYYRTGEND